jgi:hypothetical protein
MRIHRYSSRGGGAISMPKISKSSWIVGTVVTIATIILIVVVAMWAIRRFGRVEGFGDGSDDGSLTSSTTSSSSSLSAVGGKCSGAEYKLMFFQMDKCPHCVKFKPEWDKVNNHIASTYKKNKACAMEVSAKETAVCKKYNVDGFPTVVLEKVQSQQQITYDGPRTLEGLKRFLATNVK